MFVWEEEGQEKQVVGETRPAETCLLLCSLLARKAKQELPPPYPPNRFGVLDRMAGGATRLDELVGHRDCLRLPEAGAATKNSNSWGREVGSKINGQNLPPLCYLNSPATR